MEKSYGLFVEGIRAMVTSGLACKIPGALYSRTLIFLTGFIHLKALDIQPGQTGKYSPFVSQSFPPKAFPSEGPCMCNYFPNPHPCTLTSDVSPLFPRRI